MESRAHRRIVPSRCGQGLGDGERGGGADEAGAAFKWKWNIDGGELFEECLRRAKLEGHLPDLMRGCPFSGQTALTRSLLRALTFPYGLSTATFQDQT